MTAPVSRPGATDREVEAMALWIGTSTCPLPVGSSAWSLSGDADELRDLAENALAYVAHRAALLAEQPGGGR